jgi:membrane protein DedA with SNARE-associated domain
MESLTEFLRELVGQEDNLVGLAVLGGSAAIEYVFPPFPGDFVTLLGAVLVTGYGWSFPAVLAVVMAGSLLGAMAAYQVGVMWRRRRAAHPSRRPHPMLESVIARFRRHGPAFIVVNRFLPGVRGFIFVAAGLAGIDRRTVLLYASISALVWNLGIMGVGAALGANLDTLEALFERYTIVAWIAIAVAIVAILVWRWSHKRDRDPDPPST